MPRSCGLALLTILLATSLFGGDDPLWSEYGLAHTDTIHRGRLTVTAYRMKDSTGALAAWEWLRSPQSRPCSLASFCTKDKDRTVLFDGNYVLVFTGGNPRKTDLDAVINGLPDRHDTQLPPVLTFLPRNELVPGSARYLLGSASVDAFAPELRGVNLGFNVGTEGQVASYKTGAGQPVRLVVLDYPTPDMARQYEKAVSKVLGGSVKRSGVLVAAVLPPASNDQATALLSRVQYEARIVWNDEPSSTNPIKPMYELLLSIIYLSCLLSALALAAGLVYAGMRVYRRRYGTLEGEEAMTTLHLTGD
ncbi:MAG TPA: DUF6599 family protein [Bryobacteraceae bacterium]|nr:DUF6599 family protein [Bryobacteraceae bacterium]